MIYLNPDVRLYTPPLSLFGGVEVDRMPHSAAELTSKTGKVLSSISDSLRRAYEIRSVIQSEGSIVMYAGLPTKAMLADRKADHGIDTEAIARRLMKRVLAANKESALVFRDDMKGFYIFHILRDEFDPEAAGALLKTTEAAIFSLLGHRYEIVDSVTPRILQVHARVEKDPPYSYIR